MKKTKPKTKKTICNGLSLTAFVLAVITLIPFPAATETSVAGYKAVCPFSPISTILLFYTGSLLNGIMKNTDRDV